MLLLSPDRLHSQLLLDSAFLRPARILSAIPAGCTDIEVDEEGNIFLLQTPKHKVHKLFAAQQYDSSITVGGKGNGAEGFNFPQKIICPNRQSLYVLDAQNRRIVMLNTNLKVIRTIDFFNLGGDRMLDATQNFWPIAFTAGPTGELYLLNQQDIKVYKFLSTGAFQLSFGGVDYGAGSLTNPDDLICNLENYIFAIDAENQEVVIYDFYGIYQYRLTLQTPFHWDHAVTLGDYLLLSDDHNLYFRNLLTKGEKHVPLGDTQQLLDVAVDQEFFYLLFENEVHLYPTSSR